MPTDGPSGGARHSRWLPAWLRAIFFLPAAPRPMAHPDPHHVAESARHMARPLRRSPLGWLGSASEANLTGSTGGSGSAPGATGSGGSAGGAGSPSRPRSFEIGRRFLPGSRGGERWSRCLRCWSSPRCSPSRARSRAPVRCRPRPAAGWPPPTSRPIRPRRRPPRPNRTGTASPDLATPAPRPPPRRSPSQRRPPRKRPRSRWSFGLSWPLETR